MLFSCYNITKCTLTTDRQIATTRARMVHGQTVHIWWNEWKASCLLLPPHFPYRNPFRRSFSFVLFSQEKEPSLDPSALNKCDIWCLYENDGRHHIDAVGWGRPLVRRQRPCIDSFIVVFLRIAVCFCFFFTSWTSGPGDLFCGTPAPQRSQGCGICHRSITSTLWASTTRSRGCLC